MHKKNYQDILALVQAPTRYIGNEINTVKKDLEAADLCFALVFPDLYEIGTSHFGLQILYSVLNNESNIAAERFFAPAPDMEALMVQRKIPCLSMESRTPLDRFDIIGISLLYELNFTNILTLFSLSGIPFYAEQRQAVFPLVIGGGPCAFNPEPLADFFDAFVIGDGEQAVLEISKAVIAFKQQGDGKKKTLLRMLSGIRGVYVPSFFTAEYDAGGIQALSAVYGDYTRVSRAFLPELTTALFPESPIVPFGKPVHDRLRLEVARGCSRGCRFCQAGMIYRPVRERSLAELTAIAGRSLETTGYSDISLLSLSTGDYSNLPRLMDQLLLLGQGHCTAVSLPSVRAEKLTPELMHIVKKVRKTGFTIAPEAGSQRLRDIINKNLTRESIEAAVSHAFELGWKNIKLYFMLGLPFETFEDVEAIAEMSRQLASAHARGRKTVNVSTTGFIPKAHTPFQRCPQISLAGTKEKLQYLKDNLRHPKVKLKWQDPEMSLLEGVFARGDRKLSALLVAAFENGCRLDGWADYFDASRWYHAFEKTGIDPGFYTTRERERTEPLPWDHIDSGVLPGFLAREFERSAQQALTPDCRENECTGCGICDFKTLRPVVHEPWPAGSAVKTGNGRTAVVSLPDHAFLKFEVHFSKLGKARFFGHLELATIVRRAVRRAGLNVKYSQGFHPSMKLAFDTALPVGMESEEERFFIHLENRLSCREIHEKLDRQLPEGLAIINVRLYRKRAEKQSVSHYTIRFPGPAPDRKKVDEFLNRSSFPVEDLSKKGKIRRTDLRCAVEKIIFIDEQTIGMVLKPVDQRTIRPTRILKDVFNLDENKILMTRIVKTKQG